MSPQMRDRRRAERHGRAAETVAAWWLRLHGWRILGRRVRTPVGEVDLVAKRGRTVAFVEVKARGTEADLDLAVDHHRLRRVASAAEHLLARYPAEVHRIDVMLVARGRLPRHLRNVWYG